MDAAKNFAKGTVVDGILENDTSITLESGHGARFPAAPFNAVIWNSGQYPDPSDDPDVEVLRVTAKATDTFTIERGQEGTVDVDHSAEGFTYLLIAPLTAKTVNDLAPVLDRLTDDGNTFRINPGETIALDLDRLTGVATLGDKDGTGEGTKITINDPATQITFTKQPIFPDLPSTDPVVAGALYYDAGTGNVKRSAG
jgi:hypothetical protein